MKTIQEVLDKIEELGWTITDERENYLLSQISPAGQDFSITLCKTDDIDDFIESIYITYQDWDVSYETYLWLDDTGHGKNGAPYDMKDVYEDMEWCKNALLQLYNDLRESEGN